MNQLCRYFRHPFRFLTEPVWQFISAEDGLKNSVERAKLINFGIRAKKGAVGIVVKVSHDENNFEEVKIIIELHPTNAQEYLPSSLHVMILDEEATTVMEAKTKNYNKKLIWSLMLLWEIISASR
ncbi:DUF1822 family protein [Calothrix sp. NIES-3974]|uniref:DUF1822 family protein n=1 Tax=Calothrix sp. NIES-3974 TaxID=2005462 RepID=UPI0018D59A23|nr:DUF1822 family protein [Calothrix sp. NIES-3974]